MASPIWRKEIQVRCISDCKLQTSVAVDVDRLERRHRGMNRFSNFKRTVAGTEKDERAFVVSDDNVIMGIVVEVPSSKFSWLATVHNTNAIAKRPIPVAQEHSHGTANICRRCARDDAQAQCVSSERAEHIYLLARRTAAKLAKPGSSCELSRRSLER